MTMLMHTGISLRPYSRSDTKLSRPHPDTTNSSTGLGCEDGSNVSKHFSLTYSKLDQVYLVNVLQFQNFTLQLLERIVDPKVSPYKNFPTGLT